MDWETIFKPIKVRSADGKVPSDIPPPKQSRFNLERFCSLCKIFARHHPPERERPDDPIAEFRAKNITVNSIVDFLDSPLIYMDMIPKHNTPEYCAVLKALSIAILQEEDRYLQYHACRLIIVMGAAHELGRWETLMFKTICSEMLTKGTDEERDAAASHFSQSSAIDQVVINQIRNGLGHLKEERRADSLRILSELDMKHSEMIIPLLIQDSTHVSWKVRFDVIQLLKAWIIRLSPPPPPPAPQRDPDALETDDDATIKSLFHTLGTMTNKKANDDDDLSELDMAPEQLLLSGTITSTIDIVNSNLAATTQKATNLSSSQDLSPTLDKHRSFQSGYHLQQLTPEEEEKIRHLCDQCIEALLRLMWTDRSSIVREEACVVLGDLHQGKLIFDWVINLLSSSDPVKRVDALRCLTYMAVLTKESIDAYLACFKDSYSSVRIEACKVICKIEGNSIMFCIKSPLWNRSHVR